jgi:(p)ppGpp synthase/HD superfamily hydrolase
LPGVPEGLCVEVQIRTKAMHREADFGLAAHWSYKQGQKDKSHGRVSQLRQALSSSTTDALEAQAVHADQIFVLTPKGEIIELPDGSTPLDFAFHVHTQLVPRRAGCNCSRPHRRARASSASSRRRNVPRSYYWAGKR